MANSEGTQLVLKIHRLGRISFRTVKTNRDYLRHRNAGSWMYMSRLAAMKEFAFMKALKENGFPVPEPVARNRHTIVMSMIEAFPLRQISDIPNPAALYSELIDMILRLARFGLIHGDFNEFNILVKEDEDPNSPSDSKKGSEASVTPIKPIPILIDFPQMISVDHANAEMYFDRDVNCIKRFFQRRFNFVSDASGPSFASAKRQVAKKGAKRLDVEVEASGFSRKMARELEAYMKEVGVDGDSKHDGGSGSDDSESEYEDGEDEDEVEEEREEAQIEEKQTSNDDGLKESDSPGQDIGLSKEDLGVQGLKIADPAEPPR